MQWVKTGMCALLCAALWMYGCGEKEAYVLKTYTVEIKDMQFQPAELRVHPGDTVVWINRDIVAHDVTEDNKAWASPSLAPDSSWKKAVDASSSYYCSIHLVMKGKLIVEN